MSTGPLPDPRTSTIDLDAERSAVTELVGGLPGGDPDQLSFQHPWEIRAFAVAVAAHRTLGFDWSRFQQALIAEIEQWEAKRDPASDGSWSYYEHWVRALESVLVEEGIVDQVALDQDTQDVLDVPANRNHHEAHTEPIAVDPPRRSA